MTIAVSLQTQIDALRNRMTALTPNASAEDLAMLGKALESVAGQVSVLDIISIAQTHGQQAVQAVQSSRDQALAAIEQSSASALSAHEAAHQQALQTLSQMTLGPVQPMSVTLSQADGTLLPLHQGRAALIVTGPQALALLPSTETAEQPVARMVMLRNATWAEVTVREQNNPAKQFIAAPQSVLFLWASASAGSLSWQSYALAGLDNLQLAQSLPALQMGTSAAEHRLTRLSASAYVLWRLDTSSNTLRLRLLEFANGWQVGLEQTLPFEGGNPNSLAEVQLAVLNDTNLVRVWLARGSSSGSIRMQRIALAGGAFSLGGSSGVLEWLNDNNIYQFIHAASAGSNAVMASWTRGHSTSDFRHKMVRITLSGSTLSSGSIVDVNSSSSSSEYALPGSYALAVRASDNAFAFIHPVSSSNLRLSLRQNNTNFSSLGATTWWVSNKWPLGDVIASAWIGQRLFACFVDHDAAQNLRWAVWGQNLSQLASGVWTLPRAFVQMSDRRGLMVVPISDQHFVLLVGGNGSTSAPPLLALCTWQGNTPRLGSWRELALPQATGNVTAWWDSGQQALVVVQDSWSHPPALINIRW